MIIEGGKRGGRKGEKDTSGVRGERRGRYPSEVAFSLSLSLSLSLSRREGGGEDRGERTEQTVLFLSFALCPHASLSSLCMCVYRHSPANPSASSSFPCFPIEAVRKTRFFVPPLAENALALIAEREKGEWRKGKEGANGKEFPPRGLITGSQGKKEEERERQGLFELPFRNFSSLASHERRRRRRRRRRREQAPFFPLSLPCSAPPPPSSEVKVRCPVSLPPSFPRHRPTPVALRGAMRRPLLRPDRHRATSTGRSGAPPTFLWSVTLNIVCLSGRCGMAT